MRSRKVRRRNKKGRYVPKNLHKYKGNPTNIHWRSTWELAVFNWCDRNPAVESWNSEGIVVPYVCRTDNKQHRYFVDIWVKFVTGGVYLIEIKPERETTGPHPKRRKTAKYLSEVATYAKNKSKWEAAEKYASKRGWQFKIWTEKTLRDTLKIIK